MKKQPSCIEFRVAAVPIAQPRQRHAKRGKFIHNYTPSKHPVQDFKASVRMAAAKAYRGQPIDAPIAMLIQFDLPRPKRLIWKNRDMPALAHICKPDLDNLIKSVKDALSGLLWRDDSLVFNVNAEKLYVAGDSQPGVFVRINVVREEEDD